MDLLSNYEVQCPYCGETIPLVIDCSVVEQTYIEDCSVCCRPIEMNVQVDDEIHVICRHENE